MPQPFILVVLGDSTSGKTTLLRGLKKTKALSKVRIHDMDEHGCPDAGREAWRKYRVEELLADAVAAYQLKKSSIIGGWIWPHEIISSPYFSWRLNLKFVFLSIPEKEYRRRLQQRVGRGLTHGEAKLWAAGFRQRNKKLENQVRSTKHHEIFVTTEHSRAKLKNKVVALCSAMSRGSSPA